MRVIVALLLCVGFFSVLSIPAPVYAQSGDEVTQISKELFCPLCTGVRVDACDLPLCDQMRDVIRQKLSQGATKEEIKAYFVEQYGSVVLGIPPKRGDTVLVWVLPFLVLLAAGAWLYRLVVRWAQESQEAGDRAGPARAGPLPDEYLKRLEQELEEFD